MKMIILSAVFFVTSSTALSQHNYLITSPIAESTFIRDAVVVNDETLLCALDLRIDKNKETGVAQMNSSGIADWAKRIEIEESQELYTYDVLAHKNGSYYVHGLVLKDFMQYAFVLRVSAQGKIQNQTFFDLGRADFCAINHMKTVENGDMLLSFSHYEGTSFVRLSPEGKVVWGTTVSRDIGGTGKQPGYDFFVLEDESILAVGKNNGQFGIITVSPKGRVKLDDNISMGDYSQAKTIQVLPDGNLFITGDYLRSGSFTTFLMKVDGNSGSPIWAKEIDQFDGSFHFQQTELVNDEIHLTMMGNNDPSMNDPEFQNYYMRLDYNGDVIEAYKNGDRYDLADYQCLIRLDESSIIYGSAFNEDRNIAGIVHSYKSHDLDMCYWSRLEVTTSPVSSAPHRSFGANEISSIVVTNEINAQLTDLKLVTESTCEQVWNESTQLEEVNAVAPDALPEVLKSLVENSEFAREIHESSIVEHEFTVFPNPNDGRFTIRTTYYDVNAAILDMTGKVIYQGQLENGDIIDLSDHPTGVYIMQIQTETEMITRRVQIR